MRRLRSKTVGNIVVAILTVALIAISQQPLAANNLSDEEKVAIIVGVTAILVTGMILIWKEQGHSMPGYDPQEGIEKLLRARPVPPLAKKAFDSNFKISSDWKRGQSQFDRFQAKR